jgi:hypothetical protein
MGLLSTCNLRATAYLQRGDAWAPRDRPHCAPDPQAANRELQDAARVGVRQGEPAGYLDPDPCRYSGQSMPHVMTGPIATAVLPGAPAQT